MRTYLSADFQNATNRIYNGLQARCCCSIKLKHCMRVV